MTAKSAPSTEELLGLLRTMLLIRRVEERLRDDFHAGKLPGGVHLYIGQEAIAAGVCAHLNDDDWIASTHRGHGHFLAKGGDPRAMIAEIHGKETGICRGMGGSMHVADFSRGIIGANGIVGGGVGITVGAALAAQLENRGQVAVCFFGDGAANQGVFMEALNVGALWKLPLVLICEHNGFSEFSPSDTVTAGDIADRPRAFGIPSTSVDGNDALAVREAAGAAVEHARRGNGPSFLLATTYRTHGHNEGEMYWLSGTYREESEIEEWNRRDPIDRLTRTLVDRGTCTLDEVGAMDREILDAVDDACAFAEASPAPAPEAVRDLMFFNQAP